jgi:uncharacterized delta-60 repeat protein
MRPVEGDESSAHRVGAAGPTGRPRKTNLGSRTLRLAALLTTTALLSVGTAFAADINPVVNVSTTLANDLRGVTFAADGKILTSGHVGFKPEDNQLIVARWNADGTLDTSFDTDGIVQLDLAPGRQEQSLAIAELAGGDIVVAANVVDEDMGQSVYLLRFDNTGKQKVAPEWGDAHGKLEIVFGWANADNAGFKEKDGKKPADTAWSLKVDKSSGEEKLVLAGFGAAANGTGRSDNDRYVLRLNTDGSYDPTFNGGKPFTFNSGSQFSDAGRNALVEEDGTILSAGYTAFGEGQGNHVILLRILKDGTLDPAFGNFVEPQSTADATGVKAQPGVAIFNPLKVDGGVAEAYGVAKLKDGSYVTAGYGEVTAEGGTSTLGFQPSAGPDVVSFHVLGNKLDPDWGTNGILAIQSEGKGQPTAEDRARNVVGLSDGRVIEIGRFGGNAAAFVVNSNGHLDPVAGEAGIIKLGHPSVDAQFYGAAQSADGKRIALTTNNSAGGARLVVLEMAEEPCDE